MYRLFNSKIRLLGSYIKINPSQALQGMTISCEHPEPIGSVMYSLSVSNKRDFLLTHISIEELDRNFDLKKLSSIIAEDLYTKSGLRAKESEISLDELKSITYSKIKDTHEDDFSDFPDPNGKKYSYEIKVSQDLYNNLKGMAESNEALGYEAKFNRTTDIVKSERCPSKYVIITID